ncbi:MAG: PAS domain-containing protein, partial [Rhodanobacteraceae bacterium]
MNVVLLVVAIVAALVAIALAAGAWYGHSRVLRELKTSRERYMLVAEGANDGIFDFDVASRRLYVSPRVRQMLGYPESELARADDLKRVIVPEDYEAARAAVYDHLRRPERGVLKRTMRMRTRDGRVLTILARSVAQYADDGAPLRMAGSCTDMTERLRDERRLRIAASVFEAGSDGILVSDADQRILSVNSAFLRMTDYQRAELTGRPLRDVQVVSGATAARDEALRDDDKWSGE